MLTLLDIDKDSSRWKLDDDVSQRRHASFWQLYEMETMTVRGSVAYLYLLVVLNFGVKSLHFGRPPLLSDAFIDCPAPLSSPSFLSSSCEHHHRTNR